MKRGLQRSEKTTPNVSIMKNIISNLKSEKEMVVLLSTGAYNPPHSMHIKMFKKAKDYLEKNHDMIVIGSYISPSHDKYLEHKYGSSNELIVPARARSAILNIMIKNEGYENFLFVDHWEYSSKSFVDHTRVLKTLHGYVKNVIRDHKEVDSEKIRIRTCYLAGKDLFLRCRGHSWIQKPELGVVVMERDDTPRVASLHHKHMYEKFKKEKGPHLFFVETVEKEEKEEEEEEEGEDEKGFSSTKLREFLRDGRFDEIPETFLCKEAVKYIQTNIDDWKRK